MSFNVLIGREPYRNDNNEIFKRFYPEVISPARNYISDTAIAELLDLSYSDYATKLTSYGASHSSWDSFYFDTIIETQCFVDDVIIPILMMRIISECAESF